MRYLTREWFALVQMENRLRYLKKLPEGNWDEGEIRSFVRREREAYVLREQKDWAHWAKGQTEEMKAAQPFDPAESAAWFNSGYRWGCRMANRGLPDWLAEGVDRRLLALGYIPAQLWPRRGAELRRIRRSLRRMNERIREAKALEEQRIPEDVRRAFQLHDACLLSLRRKGGDAVLLLNNGGGTPEWGKPYERLTFRGVTLFSREPGIVLRTKEADRSAGPVAIRVEGMPEWEVLSGWKVLYWELYREEGEYEVRLMLTNGEKQPYLTLRCREIEWAYLADPA